MRWIMDIVTSIIVTKIFSEKNHMIQEITMNFVTIILKRFLVIALTGFCLISLLTGGILISLIDLGNYLNANQNFGFSFLGQIGIALVFFSGVGLYFLLSAQVDIEETERLRLENRPPSTVGNALAQAITEFWKRSDKRTSHVR